MKKLEKRYFYSSYFTVLFSGVALTYYKYIHQSANEFSVVSHPLQIWALKSHLILAMFWTALLGYLFCAHAYPKIKLKKKSKSIKSGWTQLIIAVFLTLSGYLIQVIVHEKTLNIVVWSHIVVGFISIVSVLLHYVSARQK